MRLHKSAATLLGQAIDSQCIVRDVSKNQEVTFIFHNVICMRFFHYSTADCSIRVFQSEIPIIKFHAGVISTGAAEQVGTAYLPNF